MTEVAYMTVHSCDVPPTEVRSKPVFEEIRVTGIPKPKDARELTLQPKSEQDLIVVFTPVEAYYSYCDRFSFRVTFAVNGESLAVVAESTVSREEPYRER